MGTFKKQWEMFQESLKKLGSRLESTQREYLTLSTTRLAQLQKPLEKIDAIRIQKGISLSGDNDVSLIPPGKEPDPDSGD